MLCVCASVCVLARTCACELYEYVCVSDLALLRLVCVLHVHVCTHTSSQRALKHMHARVCLRVCACVCESVAMGPTIDTSVRWT